MSEINFTKLGFTRRRMLIKAIHDAATELATRAAEGSYLDNKGPTPDEIRAFTGDYIDPDVTDPDELWAADAINPVNGTRYAGMGRTAAEAKTSAWVNSHWPGGTGSVLVKVSIEIPDGWTFELYPPLKPNLWAISSQAIFELVRRTIPNVTLDEVQDSIMRSFPYITRGQRQ